MTGRYCRHLNTCASNINLESVRISVEPANVPPDGLPTVGAPPAPPSAVERTWHTSDSESRILAPTSRLKSLNPVKVFARKPLRSEAGCSWEQVHPTRLCLSGRGECLHQPQPYTLNPHPLKVAGESAPGNRSTQLVTFTPCPLLKGKGNNLKGLKDLHLEAKATIWPWLSYRCHIRSTRSEQQGAPGFLTLSLSLFLSRRQVAPNR